MIQLLKAKQFDGEIQHATWAAGDLRKLRAPVKRKGSAATAAATSSAPTAAAAKKHHGGRSRLPNPDGSIASISVKREPK